MLIKTLAIVFFIAILFSLGSALFHLVKRKEGGESEKTMKALTFRIGLSLALFILLFIAFAAGLFHPQGLGARMQQIQSQKAEQFSDGKR